MTGRGGTAEGRTRRTCSLRAAANESSMRGSKPANPGTRPSHVCCDAWVAAACASLNLTPSPLCSEVALVLGRSPRRFRAAACAERSRWWGSHMAFAVECLHLLSLDSPLLVCLGVAYHQRRLLGPEGNERGNPRCLCVPKAT